MLRALLFMQEKIELDCISPKDPCYILFKICMFWRDGLVLFCVVVTTLICLCHSDVECQVAISYKHTNILLSFNMVIRMLSRVKLSLLIDLKLRRQDLINQILLWQFSTSWLVSSYIFFLRNSALTFLIRLIDHEFSKK